VQSITKDAKLIKTEQLKLNLLNLTSNN